jgi:hypothetical protein
MSQKYLGPDFDKWTSQWEKSQQDGTFADAPKPPQVTQQAGPNDFFGNHRPAEKSNLKDVDAEYWRQVYDLSSHAGQAPDVISEAKKKEQDHCGSPVKTAKSKDETGKVAKTLGKNPNPIYRDTVGRDGSDDDEPEGTTRVSPATGTDEQFMKLESLKRKLYDLECKMHSSEGLSESKTKNLLPKFASIWKQIDDLSNEFSPKYGTERLS